MLFSSQIFTKNIKILNSGIMHQKRIANKHLNAFFYENSNVEERDGSE